MAPNHKQDIECDGKDTLVAGPPLSNGYRPFIRHKADHSVIEGIMRPVREGENLTHGVMAIQSRNDGTPICDVEEVSIPGLPASDACCECSEGHDGPARVTTDKYRNGWDRIFGGKIVGQA
jgi:hypothetical protein